MSSNSEAQSEGGDQGNQPELTDFVERTCPVCGRVYEKNGAVCHPSHVVKFERRLATQKWLLTAQRPPDTPPGQSPVVGSDRVSFEATYLAIRSLIQSESDRFDAYVSDTPYQIQGQKWIASVYRQYLSETDELVPGVLAGIQASENRITRRGAEVTPARVFAHLVFLDQYGLLPRYDPLVRGGGRGLSEICAEHYDVSPAHLESKWIVKRRVDRSKVHSTTPEFRQEWDVELVNEQSTRASHPHSECKPFDRTAVLGDHRDHNLVTRRAKAELLGLPDVNWALAPHIIYARADYDVSDDSSSRLPVLGFDFAGFEYTVDGQRLRYLGIVTDWNEDPFEVYLQIVQLGKTAATGVVVLPNREQIYDFLHFLKTTELTQDYGVLPEERDEYSSVPNVQALHKHLIRDVQLLDGIALLPRRKFLDEGFDTLDDLVSVPTYA